MIKVGITQGNINGVSYELILKTLEEPHIMESCIPVVYGSSKAMAYYRKTLDIQGLNISTIHRAEDAAAHRINLINLGSEEMVVELGKYTDESVKASEAAFNRALDDLKAGVIDALVLSPAVTDPFKPVLLALNEEKKGLKIWVNDTLRISLATNQINLKEVPSLLNVEALSEKIQNLRTSLIRDFKVTFPRIAVLALNPQTGEGKFGKEEDDVIRPAIQVASDKGVQCFGPYSADQWFAGDDFKKFDAVLAMYHDQGMIAFQMLTNEEGAFFIANTPYIITSSNTNAQFDKAGKNETSPDSFRNALFLAIDLYYNRKNDEECRRNPLKKQYFERGSDNEKLDLSKED
ncbi:MAG: 4-hydroxythreonine-4-phosphate dehydrogenase PdxA [Dysgonamonadaceae bacterium]|jgi:4-hydroxythreonine-4-phosphate dehydrogenase|nr:4-hydroxythreonine-4-phosphate dehydrogenase PdxA [Dysgonamonadaceae bacterium]